MKLTQEIVRKAIYQGEAYESGNRTRYRRYVLWDDELPGFGLRVYPTGRKVFVILYRVGGRGGRQRLMSIGPWGVLTLKEARADAKEKLLQALRGTDPMADRDAAAKAVTMKQWAEIYLETHAIPKKKPNSVKMDRGMLENYIVPALGPRKIEHLARRDVSDLHHSLRDKPHTANRVLSLVSMMMTLAEERGIRPDGSNPCQHVRRFDEKKRKRYASPEELARLAETMATAEQEGSESPYVLAALRLLIFTGCRVREILGAKWEDFDAANKRLAIDGKTGEREVYLTAPALEVIAGIPRTASAVYLIEGQKPDKPRPNIHHQWERLRKIAKIENLRMHDLRHTFASVGVNAGHGLPLVGALLGHRSMATTSRYAHVAPDPAAQVADRIGAELEAMMSGGEGGEVVPINRK